MQKWEYAFFYWGGSSPARRRYVEFSSGEPRWEPVRGDQFIEMLGKLGLAGWELVGYHSSEGGTQSEHIFKRPLP